VTPYIGMILAAIGSLLAFVAIFVAVVSARFFSASTRKPLQTCPKINTSGKTLDLEVRVDDRLREGRWLTGGGAALLSIAIHILLAQSVLTAEGVRMKRAPREEGLGANALAVDGEPVTTLILIEQPEAEPREGSSPEADSLEPTSDRQARAELFGRYLGQVRARIERAWWRPRAPIGSDLFDCDLLVIQDARGKVLEVTLQRCNGSIPWQMSLVRAVERASPLPAPPDPKVFTGSLRLSFTSHAYAPGADEQGFEPQQNTNL
jgi:TonB C terminal